MVICEELQKKEEYIIVKVTVILKNLMISCHKCMSEEEKEEIERVLERLCCLEVSEGCCLYLGNLVMIYSHWLNHDQLEEPLLKALA